MKRLSLYPILATALWCAGCSSPEDLYAPDEDGNKMIINAELVSSSDWATRSEENGVRCGEPGEDESGLWLVTATRDPWTADQQPAADVPVTRGTPLTSASSIANIRVNIFNTQGADWSTSSIITRTVDATRNGNSFFSDNAYNWPSDGTIKTTLFAFSPLPTANNGLTDVQPNKITYKAPATIANQPDLCVAMPTMNEVNQFGTSHIRNFALRHQLTAVGFSMLGWNLKVTSVVVSGVAADGTLTMNSGALNWAADGTLGSFTVPVTGTAYQHTVNNNFTNITKSDGYLMMVPQALSDAATVTIKYESTGTGSTGGTITVKLKDLGVGWVAGDKITYNIRLKTAPAVTTNELIIASNQKGYTTTESLSFLMDNLDNLTFTWSADWLKIHRGSPTTGISPGGAVSGWTTGAGGPWTNIYFFAVNDNTSIIADRTAVVTVSGTRSGTRTFTVRQVKGSNTNPPTADQYIKVKSLLWTNGNLVAAGNNGCRVGKPDDYGLYFQFGSLIGWCGGATGDGTGQGAPTTVDKKVWPLAMGQAKPSFGWQPGNSREMTSYFFDSDNGGILSHIGSFYRPGFGENGPGTTLAEGRYSNIGIGDPCTYYLGSPWRLPALDDWRDLTGAVVRSYWTNNPGPEGIWNNNVVYDGISTLGAWFGEDLDGRSGTPTLKVNIFLPAAGYRESVAGVGREVGASTYMSSASMQSNTMSFMMYASPYFVYPNNYYSIPYAYPVRCVRQAP